MYLLRWSQGEQTKTHAARNPLSKLTNGAETLLRKNVIVRAQLCPVCGTFPVAVELVQVAVLVGLDEADIVKINLVLRVGRDFRVPLQGDCLIS